MQIYHNKIKNFYNLLKEKNLNNDQNENFGFKKHKDEIIWYVDAKNNFVMFEVEIIEIANVWKLIQLVLIFLEDPLLEEEILEEWEEL